MIRRNDVLEAGPDQRAVKWCLVAAALALSIGCLAEAVQVRQDVAQKTVPADTMTLTTRMAT